MKYMTWENLADFAFVNTDTLKGSPRGVVVNFHGFTDGTTFEKSDEFASFMGERGIVYIFPYHSVWAWMSRSSMAYIEEVLDVVWTHFGFTDRTPFVVSGGSMGGMTSCMYTLFGKRSPCACAMNCPVTDLVRICRPWNIRAIYSAFILEDSPFDDCVLAHSPIHNITHLPDIPYYAVFGTKDICITQDLVEDFSEAMQKAQKNYRFRMVEGMEHCQLSGAALQEYMNFIAESIDNAEGTLSR